MRDAEAAGLLEGHCAKHRQSCLTLLGQLTADLRAILTKSIDVLRTDTDNYYTGYGVTKCRQCMVCSRVATLLSVTGNSMSKVKLNGAKIYFPSKTPDEESAAKCQTLKSSLVRSLLTGTKLHVSVQTKEMKLS